ncbi:unnamed protein product [Adineta steineri]|uniref:Uncharacterized protein n=1 Tax=Adineta steineri TaxID=433720 RepID=A0A813U5H6_9BILA|nr:unnamed protein product [Adineta steineri]CAF0821363.1 unnamed protein product [Adineta steineri]CAF3714455.1 unnamed protein product [Adineta steineri]CAF3911258.1 unnamed protein product [Adineta steineri]
MDKIALAVAKSKPNHSVHPLQLAQHSDKIVIDAASSVPGITQEHVGLAEKVFDSSRDFRQTMINDANMIRFQTRMAARHSGFTIEDCRRGEHVWLALPSGPASHSSRVDISQKFSHLTTDSQSATSVAFGPYGRSRNSNSSMQSNNSGVTVQVAGSEMYQLQERCVICGQSR